MPLEPELSKLAAAAAMSEDASWLTSGIFSGGLGPSVAEMVSATPPVRFP